MCAVPSFDENSLVLGSSMGGLGFCGFLSRVWEEEKARTEQEAMERSWFTI
jgi:hypothetical protein